MVLYYTYDYSGNKEESHKLLEKAIDLYLESQGGAKDTAAELMKDMEIGEMGKPEIAGFDDFSISHTVERNDEGRKAAWAVLIDRSECGLDIQFSRKVNWQLIAEKYYSDEECAALKAKPSDGEFFRLWSRREALVKSVGTTIVNSNLPSTLGETVEFEGRLWHLRDVTLPGSEGLFTAVCTLADGEIDVREI